ncbi:MAG: carboxypeptidase regulatory-like domain-containing protein [Acidobacteria bacterium]|nr:carboxypeptidase regulatory-like domain-containing protein [Acidobacteriota bacterium]
MFNRIFTVLVFALLTSLAWAQNPKKETATVSGTVTLNGSPMRNVVVSLQVQNQPGSQHPARAKTDGDGRFRFTDVAAGQYLISTQTPGFYFTSDSTQNGLPGRVLNVANGETIENIELRLKRGAVITGQVIDENNQPIAEIPVQLSRVGDQLRLPQNMLNFEANKTDDRGIYRLYGLPPGKYQVSVGIALKESYFSVRTRTFIEQTFHPDTTDQTKAKVIELEEGQEASNVDIRIGNLKSAYEISGRVVDSQTGQPVTNANLSMSEIDPARGKPRGWMATGGWRTDINGEFHVTGIRSGQYGIFIRSQSERDEYFSDPVTVEIINKDLSGIEIRAQRGASISGWAIIEGTNDPAILAKRSQIRLSAHSEDNAISTYAISTQVKPDGSFRLVGVPVGNSRLKSFANVSTLSLVRVEQNGVPVKDDTIQTRAGEQINNVRVIFAHTTAAIRGKVTYVGGEPPEEMQLFAYVKKVGSKATDKSSSVDARGYFVIEGLLPGQYTLQLSPNYFGTRTPETNKILGRIYAAIQHITVTGNNPIPVTFTIDLTPEGKKQ